MACKSVVKIDQGGAGGTREPRGGKRTMVPGGANGPEAEARAMGASSLDVAGDWRTQGRSTHLIGLTGDVEGLEGASRGRAEELAGL